MTADLGRDVPRVATVGGQPIPVSRLEQRLAELRRGPRGRHVPPPGGPGSITLERWIVQELVAEAILELETREGGFADPMDLVVSVTADITIPEADVRTYYDRNQDLYRHAGSRRVRHAFCSDEATAERLAVGLAHGNDLGEDLEVRRGELTGSLEDAIFAADLGATIGPIRTEHGWHVARVEADTPPWQTSFEEARPAIVAELLEPARARAFDAWLDRRRQALATIEPDFEHPAHPVHGFPSHRH